MGLKGASVYLDFGPNPTNLKLIGLAKGHGNAPMVKTPEGVPERQNVTTRGSKFRSDKLSPDLLSRVRSQKGIWGFVIRRPIAVLVGVAAILVLLGTLVLPLFSLLAAALFGAGLTLYLIRRFSKPKGPRIPRELPLTQSHSFHLNGRRTQNIGWLALLAIYALVFMSAGLVHHLQSANGAAFPISAALFGITAFYLARLVFREMRLRRLTF